MSNVQSETKAFCSKYAATTQGDVQADAGAVLSGDDQPKGGHDGNVDNEKGYNMTVTVVPNCAVEGATVQYPLGSANPGFNCTTILFDTWRDCE